MRYRPLGRTGEEVSILGLGTASLGHVFGEIDEAAGERAVHAAIDLGINIVDCSPYYGDTRAEVVLGRALRSVPRDRYLLATKAGRYGLADFDFSPARIRKSLDQSLRRLGVETIDLFQLHDVEFCDLDRIVAESVPALQELKASGRIRFFGVTGLPLAALRRLADACAPDTVLSYCHHCLHDDTLTADLPFYEDRGVGVINASSTGMALLTERGPMDWHPADQEIKDTCRRAVAWCRERGTSITRLALQFAVREPRITTTLVGMASEAEVRQNLAWIDEPFDEEAFHGVRAVLAPIRDRTWPSGRPENQ